ncbi:MAG: regulatory iron-sulfur-containing complex subunit RicT [Bacteriovoracales bacterium]|nr:regulatory iron-sulfur-containing complex subunit RicT [Bacteriovoracales bacterium]
MERTDTLREETSSTPSALSEREKNRGRYREGQTLQFIRVRFPGHAHSYPFILGKRSFSYGQKVMALSDRGMTVGYVNSFPYEAPYQKELEPIRTISRPATDEDENTGGSQESKEKEMEELCKKLIEKHRLNMNLTHVELIAYGKKVVFYFTAPQRVDFRALIRDLVGELKMKIELRQIGQRERAAALGGLGPCGLSLCCSTFLNRYGNISIKMAKLQNLSLVPAKLNGLCGQLKCCLSYEQNVYRDKLSRLPEKDELIETLNGDRGKVLRHHIIPEEFDMLTDRGVIRRYHALQYDPQKQNPKPSWEMPQNFDHISQETSTVIGPPPPPQKAPEKPLAPSQDSPESKPSQTPVDEGRPPSPPPRPPAEKKTPSERKAPSDLSAKAKKNNPFNKKRRKRKKR